jgi:hypothetical protein
MRIRLRKRALDYAKSDVIKSIPNIFKRVYEIRFERAAARLRAYV